MNIKTLVEVGQAILSGQNGGRAPEGALDVRTIRYYDALDLLGESPKDGRENRYGAKHLKRLLALKALQMSGYSLSQIKGKRLTMADVDVLLAENGYNVAVLERLVTESDAQQKEREEMKRTGSKKHKLVKKAGKVLSHMNSTKYKQTKKPITVDDAGQPQGEVLSTTVTNPVEYELVRQSVRVGSAFAFIDGLEGEGSRKLHTLLHGQRAGAGVVSRAVIAVDDSGIDLPGCTLKGRAVDKNSVCVMVPDKDVYKEGDGVARVFVFDPQTKNGFVTVAVSLDGAPLDNVQVELDDNGCGLMRYPTLVSGEYSLSIAGGRATCRFFGARYELAPLTVVVESARAEASDVVRLSLAAESFGSPFSGRCRMRAIEDGVHAFLEGEVEFKDGKFELPLGLSGKTGAISVQFSSKDDARLVASTPVQGARKEEREGTEISKLGAITSISLLRHESSRQAKGLFFDASGASNTPVVLGSCVGRSIELSFNDDASDVVVFVRASASGEKAIVELGNVKRGQTKSVAFGGGVAMFHIGMFVGGKPWEGHAAVVAPASGGLFVEAPSEAQPGEEFTFKVRAPMGSSVLVKILDKRLRAQDEAITAAAARLKRWISEAILGRHTGRVNGRLPEHMNPRTYWPLLGGIMGGGGVMGGTGGSGLIGSSGLGDGWTYAAPPDANIFYSTDDISSMVEDNSTRSLQLTGQHTNSGGSSMGPGDVYGARVIARRGASPVDGFAGQVSNFVQSRQERVVFTQPNFYSPLHAQQNWQLPQSRVPVAAALAAEAVVEKQAKKARETEADIVYCDLLRVDVERSVTIRLPDVIGAYDIKAFGASNGGADWDATESSVRVSKNVYVEPLIPRLAHPDDRVMARAVIVGAPDDAMCNVRVNGSFVQFERTRNGANIHLRWPAALGVHEVSVVSSAGSDKVARVVEEPGEEVVLTQELLILKKGKRFDVSEEGAISVQVMPGIQRELALAVSVCVDFQHSCCEQTSAKLVAAFMAFITGDDSSRDKSRQSIINGEARLRSMYSQGRGFAYYPGGSVNEWASATTARRVLQVSAMLDGTRVPPDIKQAVASLKDMANDVSRAHGGLGAETTGKMESAYFARRGVSDSDVRAVLDGLGAQAYAYKAEACYCAAALLAAGSLDDGIRVANEAAKAMGGANGGGWHGTVESLAYMHLVNELRKAGVVPGAKGTHVKIDGEKVPLEAAVGKSDASVVEAVDGAVALRVNRIEKIRFDEARSNVPIVVELKPDGDRIRAGNTAKLVVKLSDGYKQGDVLCVALPDCLSQVVGGALAKKIQVDFSGKDSIEIQVAVHEADGPQRWSSVVRNMYDGSRLGSVGTQLVNVS
jgi:DNA-binding transcriptional MerR regulator